MTDDDLTLKGGVLPFEVPTLMLIVFVGGILVLFVLFYLLGGVFTCQNGGGTIAKCDGNCLLECVNVRVMGACTEQGNTYVMRSNQGVSQNFTDLLLGGD